MNRFLIISFCLVLQACAQKPWYGDLDFLAKLPTNLSEVSGIVSYDQNSIWAIEDNGNKDVIYKVSLDGRLIRKLKVKNAKNHDWEDLTKDKAGNMYIGDFGNNDNDRKNLVIYKLPNPELEKGKEIKAQKIQFNYPEQEKFPPKKKALFYDAEGFFHWGNSLYVFTKDRSQPYKSKTLVYQIPDKAGEYKATLIGTLNLCEDRDHCSVTAATISEDGKTIVLLGYGYLYTLKDFDFKDLSKIDITTTYLKHETQIESVCFLNQNTVLIADEQSMTKGRNLYRYMLK